MAPVSHGPSKLVAERLRIRPLEIADAEALFVLKSDPTVMACYGQEAHPSIDRAREWVLRNV